MKLPDLLNQLDSLNNRNEKEADKYLAEIRNFLKATSGKQWTPQHEAVFLLLQKRIVDSAFYKRLFVGASAILLLAALLFGGVFSFSWENYLSQAALLEIAKSSTLPLKLEQLDPAKKFLTVKISEDFGDFDADQQQQLQGLVRKFPILGRHYSLGENVRLHASFLPIEKSVLIREPVHETPLGKIGFREMEGSIWPSTGINALMARQAFMIGEPIQYRKSGEPVPFYVAVVGIDKETWEIRFSENGVLWSKSYFLAKTNKGDIEELPYLVYEEGWKGLHFVAIGIGRYGEEDGNQYAWQLKSFVRSIQFAE